VIQTIYDIVKVHGGTKEVISTEGKGSIFLFTFPALAEQRKIKKSVI
jgi:signal transduction histidine kinase